MIDKSAAIIGVGNGDLGVNPKTGV